MSLLRFRRFSKISKSARDLRSTRETNDSETSSLAGSEFYFQIPTGKISESGKVECESRHKSLYQDEYYDGDCEDLEDSKFLESLL